MQTMPLDRKAESVLVVDDVPENLALLHDALDESGYRVFVATNGESALESARQTCPAIVLLDALMPGMDGFEVCRRMKADPQTQHVPVLFMTGLSEAQHVVAAFEAGGTDYVTKPIRPAEVLARIASHLRTARQMERARSALDAFGQAAIAISVHDGRLTWQTPLARRLLQAHFPVFDMQLPLPVLRWVDATLETLKAGSEPAPLVIANGTRRLLFSKPEATGEDEWLIVLREESDDAVLGALMSGFKLTHRESEVLYWVIKGKTNRDIGDILGTSPRTVTKHLEHIFEKLSVETRTAAAALGMSRVRQLQEAR